MLTINAHPIGPTHPVFIIAEIGVNHDGSLARALELVEHARRGGADAVKLQVFRARILMHGSGQFAAYQQERCPDADPAAMLARYELSDRALDLITASIRDAGMVPLATPFSLPDIDALDRLALPAIKIASPDLVNYPLLERAARLRRPMLLSTGAATLDEIDRTCEWLDGWRASYAFLHCVSSYPTPDPDANLCWIPELSCRFAVPIGYSDHTTGLLAGAMAVAAGACIIEKHLTYDRNAEGPDHSASADPAEFGQYVQSIRLAERLRGRPGKRILDCEQDVRTVSRQSLVTLRDIPPGHTLTPADLSSQRPGTAISAAETLRVIGRKTLHPIPAGTLLDWTMLAA